MDHRKPRCTEGVAILAYINNPEKMHDVHSEQYVNRDMVTDYCS